MVAMPHSERLVTPAVIAQAAYALKLVRPRSVLNRAAKACAKRVFAVPVMSVFQVLAVLAVLAVPVGLAAVLAVLAAVTVGLAAVTVGLAAVPVVLAAVLVVLAEPAVAATLALPNAKI